MYIICFFIALLPIMAMTKKQCRLEMQKWPAFREIHNEITTSEIYKKQYDLALSLNNYQEKPRIPKIIHQIWLGSPVPKKFQDLINTWKEKHPDWEHRLWTDSDVSKFQLINKTAYNLAPNYGMKSDILRYEILHRYGGLYVDTDQEALMPHDIFHHITDFYMGFFHNNQTPSTSGDVGNGVIGSCKEHFFLQRMITYIKSKTMEIAKITDVGCGPTLAITGPHMILKLLQKYKTQIFENNPNQPFLVLPKPFFYPLDVNKHKYVWLPLSQEFLAKYLYPFTYGIQYHTSSWIELNTP
jgi:mannosyltransferase OCH1-like enzyme